MIIFYFNSATLAHRLSQRFSQLFDRLITVGFLKFHAMQEDLFDLRADIRAELTGRNKFFFAQQDGIADRRFLAGNHIVNGCAQRVFICAGVQCSTGHILFRRGITVFKRDGMRPFALIVIGRAKVKQNRLAVGITDDDIVRAYVAMNKTRLMNRLQRGHDRLEQFKRFLPAKASAALLNHSAQRYAFHIFHDDIHGVVLRQSVIYLYNAGNRTQFDNGAALALSTAFACFKVCFAVTVIGRYPVCPLFSCDQFAGEILLDRNDAFQVIPADVGDAKAAAAQHFTHDILIGQHHVRQNAHAIDAKTVVKTAFGAHTALLRQFSHTGKTVFFRIHCGSPF